MGSLRHPHRIAGTAAFLTALAPAGGVPASADTVSALGSGRVARPGADGPDFGEVCADTTVTRSVDLAASRVGIGSNTANVFASGSTVTLAAGQVSFSPDSGSSPSSGNSAGAALTGSGINADGGRILTPTITWKAVSCGEEPPLLELPEPIAQEAGGADGATVRYSASALPAGTTIGCSPPSGTVFPPGATTVACEARASSGSSTTGESTSATDSAGTCTRTFSVDVVGTASPVLVLPEDLTEEATGPRAGRSSSRPPPTTPWTATSSRAACSPGPRGAREVPAGGRPALGLPHGDPDHQPRLRLLLRRSRLRRRCSRSPSWTRPPA